MFLDEEHPDVSLSDWEAFRKGFSPCLIEEVLNRKDVRTPDWEVPLARGYAIASRILLRQAGRQSRTQYSRGWRQGKMYFVRENGPHQLYVTQYYNQDLWAISRRLPFLSMQEGNEMLVFLFGSTPMLTRTCQSAIDLADLSADRPPPSLRWISTIPDQDDAVKFAHKRRATEARAERNARSERRRLCQLASGQNATA